MATKQKHTRKPKPEAVQDIIHSITGGVIEVEDVLSLATILLMHRPQPGGHIQVRLRPEFVLRKEEQVRYRPGENLLESIARSTTQFGFFAMIRNCLLTKEPHDGLLWLNPGGPLEGRDVFTARVTPLFTGLDMVGNARRFAEEMCPFCSHVQVFPPEQMPTT
ncbi:MAG: hypothetical protein WCW66_06180 [Patescibacteria group bacterium]